MSKSANRFTYIFIFCFLYMIVSLYAISGIADDDTKHILNVIHGKQNSVESYSVDFEIYRGGKLTTKGYSIHKKPNLYKIEKTIVGSDLSPTNITISNGTYLWTYYLESSVVIKNKAEPTLNASSFYTNLDIKSDNYEYTDEAGDTITISFNYEGLANVDGVTCYQIDAKKKIQTRDSQTFNYNATLYFNKDIGNISKIIWYNNDGGIKSMWLFKNFKIISIDESVFKFIIPEDATLNDWTKN